MTQRRTRGRPAPADAAQANAAPVKRPDGPPLFPFHLVRTRLVRELAAEPLPLQKTIAIAAPTGYGKTVLMSALYHRYEEAGVDCRWTALDERDASVERVLTRLERALLDAGADVNLHEAMHEGDVIAAERVASILEVLLAPRAPLVIFIDNLNACTDESLRSLLDALIFRTPAWVYFVFSSTLALPLHHARAKIEGRIRGVGYAELGLTRDDIADLMGPELCRELPEDGLDLILRQTEGWPAAVRLVQIILSDADDPRRALTAFSGADEDLAELLNRQVLQTFDTRTRQFLLELSLLRTFNAELCRAATGESGTAEFIQTLISRNLFVIPLDRNRSNYRLHGLFREFLVDEARRSLPQLRRSEVLSNAAVWCESAGQWQDAVDYALASDNAALAVDMLERVAALYVRDRGDLRQYIEWIERLEDIDARPGREADYWYVWALVFHRRYEHARKQLRRLIARVGRTDDGDFSDAEIAAYRRRIDIIECAIDVYTDHLTDAIAHTSQWLPPQPGDDPFNVATVACAAAIPLIADHRFSEANAHMRVAQSAIGQADSEYGVGWVNVLSALQPLMEGDFLVAHQRITSTLERLRDALGDGAGLVGTTALLAAKCAVELGRDDEAAPLLAQGLRRLQTHGLVGTAMFGLDAALKLWRDEPREVVTLPQLRELAAGYPPRLSLAFSCLLIRRLVRLGRIDDAVAEAAKAGIPIEGPSVRQNFSGVELTADVRDLIVAAQIDLDVARGRLRPATTKIDKQAKIARDASRWGRLVELALDEAAIAVCSHSPAPAARHLARAISLAAKRGYKRPFRDREALVAGLVNETKLKDWGFVIDEEREFFAEICKTLPLTNSGLLDQLDELNIVSSLSDTPTARELELLSLVEAGLTNQQLADRLSVSVATVKWHLYNLYTKLGVSNRAGALSRARALNLLSR